MGCDLRLRGRAAQGKREHQRGRDAGAVTNGSWNKSTHAATWCKYSTNVPPTRNAVRRPRTCGSGALSRGRPSGPRRPNGRALEPRRYNPRPAMRIARQFLVSGRVQGVGFRYYVQDVATREGVTGYVRNLPDGRVEAHVEGDADAVTRVERAIHSGPAGARVEYVDTEVLPPSGQYKS